MLPPTQVTMEILDLAKSLDLPLQIFEVTTPDGYIIEVNINSNLSKRKLKFNKSHQGLWHKGLEIPTFGSDNWY